MTLDILSDIDTVFYCIGSTIHLPEIHRLLPSPSRVFLVGVPNPNDKISVSARDIHSRKSLLGSYGGLTVPSRDFPIYLDFINSGLVDVDHLLGHTYQLSDSKLAFTAAMSGMGKRVQFSNL